MAFGAKRNSPSYGSISFKRRDRKKLNTAVIYEIMTWTAGCIASVVVGAFIVYFLGLRIPVVGTSMEPTLRHSEQVLLDRISYQFTSPKRGDVIAFYPNGNTKTHIYIKRVIGLPGERIKIADEHVYINDARYFLDISEYTRDAGIAENEIELGLDEYFVLGDNRLSSEDSRSANIGNIRSETIEGKVWFKLGAADRKMGFVK